MHGSMQSRARNMPWPTCNMHRRPRPCSDDQHQRCGPWQPLHGLHCQQLRQPQLAPAAGDHGSRVGAGGAHPEGPRLCSRQQQLWTGRQWPRDACVARAVFNLHAVCGITRPCDAHSCSTEQALGGFAPHCTCSAPWPSSNRAAEPFASPSAKWWPLAPRSRQAQVMRWGSTHKSAAPPASCCCCCCCCCCCSCTRWSGRTGGWEPAHAVACTPAGIVGPCVKG